MTIVAEKVGNEEKPSPVVTLDAHSIETGYNPKIVGILCNWCSYAGADLAGSLHKDYPANIRIIRVMCTGRIDPQFIMRAFAAGADGVLVSGCHPGECHYRSGNYKADRMISLLRVMLSQMSVNPDRLMLTWVSASEAVKFSRIVTKFTEDLKKLGPLIK